jgi:multiple sugar transport system substrate-binding protein
MRLKAIPLLVLVLTLALVAAQCVPATEAPVEEAAPATEAPEEEAAPATEVPEEEAAPAEKIQLVMWHQQNQVDARESFQALLDAFMEANPDVEITQQIFNWVDVKPKVMAAIAAGTTPDTLQVIPDMLVPILDTGAVQPIDDLIAEIDAEVGLYETAKSPFYSDGHYWAVPTFGLAQMLYYRPSYLEDAGVAEAPRTWEDLLSVVEKCHNPDEGIYGIGIPLAQSMYTDQVLWDFIVTAGGDIYDEQGDLTFDSPEVIEALEIMKKLSVYSPPDSTNWVWEDANNALYQGNVCMIFQFGHMSYEFSVNNPDNPNDLLAAPVPKNRAEGNLGAPNAFSIFTTDPVKREAIDRFWKFAMSPEQNAKWLGNMSPGLLVPLSEEAAKLYLDQPGVQKFAYNIEPELEEAVPYAKQYGFTHEIVPANIGPIAAQNLMGAAVQKMILEDLSPEEAAKWGQEQMEAVEVEE